MDVRIARSVVPPECAIVAVAPRKTLGGILFISYEAGSTLVYRELAIVAALVRIGRRMAFYLPRLYVDSAPSVAGGRAIWGLPKDLATFDVAASGRRRTITVRSADLDVCRIRVSGVPAGLRLPALMPAFGARADRFLFFTGRLSARFSVARVQVSAPPGGEIAALSLDRSRRAVTIDAFTLSVPPPVTVMRRG